MDLTITKNPGKEELNVDFGMEILFEWESYLNEWELKNIRNALHNPMSSLRSLTWKGHCCWIKYSVNLSQSVERGLTEIYFPQRYRAVTRGLKSERFFSRTFYLHGPMRASQQAPTNTALFPAPGRQLWRFSLSPRIRLSDLVRHSPVAMIAWVPIPPNQPELWILYTYRHKGL